MVFGVVQTHATRIGLIAAVLVTLIVASLTHRTGVVATVAFISGAFGQLWGAAIIHAKRWMVKTIG